MEQLAKPTGTCRSRPRRSSTVTLNNPETRDCLAIVIIPQRGASSVLTGDGGFYGSNPMHAEVAMTFKGFDRFGKFLARPPVRASYCVDCLSHLYGEPAETIREYLDETGIVSYQAHCRNWRGPRPRAGIAGLGQVLRRAALEPCRPTPGGRPSLARHS